MTKSDAVQYFDSSVTALADALGIGKSAISNWGDYPPDGRQIQIHHMTDGFLKAEPHIKMSESTLARKRRRVAFKHYQKTQRAAA